MCSHRARALFRSRLVGDQHPVGLAEVLGNVVTLVGGDTVGVPHHPTQFDLSAVIRRWPAGLRLLGLPDGFVAVLDHVLGRP
jgi:hypothetical protein